MLRDQVLGVGGSSVPEESWSFSMWQYRVSITVQHPTHFLLYCAFFFQLLHRRSHTSVARQMDLSHFINQT